LNKKLVAGGTFCDLVKAFDCVNHDVLLSKFELYGITGADNVLYKTYLNDRYQKALIYNINYNNSTLSNRTKIKHGVAQGSILGPQLFLLYLNDLTKNNKSIPMLFADDTSILFTNTNLINCNKDIRTVFELVV